jgi:outer membrane lipoprotein carrier protein
MKNFKPSTSFLCCIHKAILYYRYRIIRSSLLVFVAFMTVSPASGQQIDPLHIARKLQSTYENAANVVAHFSQTTTMKFSPRVRQGAGEMIFLKPGRMRWDYISPDYQVLISDGETISMYFEKSSQMIISNAKDYLQSDVTYSFFAGTGNILTDFDISDPGFENNQPDTYLIKLIPKTTHPQVSSMHVWISRETFLIEQLQIIDHFDTVTNLYFTNIKIDADSYGNRKIGEDLFYFTPPAGTEIIEQF